MDLVGEVKHVAPSSHEIIIGWYGPAHVLPSGGSCLFSHLAGCSNYGEEEHLALIEALDSGDSQRGGPPFRTGWRQGAAQPRTEILSDHGVRRDIGSGERAPRQGSAHAARRVGPHPMTFPPRVAGRESSKWTLATIPILLLATAFPAASQTAVSADPTCPDCAIRLDPLLNIGDADAESWVEFTERLLLVDMLLILTRGSVPTELSIFSSEGVFQRNLGRSGGGPGEFGWIHDIAQTRDGRLHVSDRRHGRISIYAPDLTLERVVPLPARPVDVGLLALEDGSYVVNALVGTAELMGLPLHRIGPEGEILLVLSGALDRGALRAGGDAVAEAGPGPGIHLLECGFPGLPG